MTRSGISDVLRFIDQTGRDPSACGLLVANLVTIGFAVFERWDPALVMRVYWGQSVIIGVFNFLRILSLQHYSTDGLESPFRGAAPFVLTKVGYAVFFLAHYGLVHFTYLMFIRGMDVATPPHALLVPLAIAAFGVTHTFSFVHNLERDARKKRSLGKLMRLPYARVIPMHLMAVFGSTMTLGTSGLVMFLSLKTVADIVSHECEHWLREDEPVEVT